MNHTQNTVFTHKQAYPPRFPLESTEWQLSTFIQWFFIQSVKAEKYVSFGGGMLVYG